MLACSLGWRRLIGAQDIDTKSLIGSLGRLLWMLYGTLLVIRRCPLIFRSPLGARSLLGFFCAFGLILGVLRPLFAHGASFYFRLGLADHCFNRS